MRNTLNRATTVLLMAAVLVTGSFAMTSEDTFAASKAPAKPKITKAAVYNSNNVKLQWSKAKNAIKYKVYRKKADGKFVLVKTTQNRTYQSKSLAYGTKYTYKVTAISKAGKKNTSKVKVVYTKPAKPVITTKVFDTNNVKITWKSTKGAAKYKVYRKKADGKFVLVKTTTEKTYESKNLAYDTKYTYKVKAVSKAGKMNESAVKSVTSGSKPVVPAEPSEPTTPDMPVTPEQPSSPSTPNEPSTPADPGTPTTPAEPSEPTTPETPVAPEQPNTPAVPSEPSAPEEEEEKLIKFYSPIYDTDYVYYIKDKNGELIYKTKNADAFNEIIQSEIIYVDGVEYKAADLIGTFGEGNITTIREYQLGLLTESKWETSSWKDNPDIIIADEAPAAPKLPEITVPAKPEPEPEPEQPAERTVTVKVPIYETETVYWIREYATGDVVYKTTDPVAFEQEILTRPEPDKWHFGSGAFDNDGDGYGDEKYKIILGYEEEVFTESEYNYLLENSDIGKMPGIIVIWND